MARITGDSGLNAGQEGQESLTLQAHGTDRIDLPSTDLIADAVMTRQGQDLILRAPDGETVVIEGYFSAEPSPLLVSPDGAVLTPGLVDSFSRSPSQFAANQTANDESPVGAVEEVKGNATVTRADGTVETIAIGTPIYQGDIIQTDAAGAVNITFLDETSMAVSENARFAVDQYTFDPATESGTTNFSVLRGVFVFTSGLIGRDDPDDVKIDTPVGSIGIRGTIIAGQIDPSGESNITVLEGAIVVSNGLGNTTLSQQFETVKLSGFDKAMEPMGVVPASDIGARFSSVGAVLPTLFSMVNDAAAEQSTQPQQQQSAPPASQGQTPSEQNNAPADNSSSPTSQSQPAPAPLSSTGMESMDLSGNTSSMGLPSANTIAGAPSLNADGTLSGSNMFAATGTTPAGSSSAGTNSSASAAPSTTGSTTASASNAAPPSTSSADPQPLPHTAGPNNGGTAGGGTTLSYTAANFTDTAGYNVIVGNVNSGTAGTTYALSGAGAAYFSLVNDGAGGMHLTLSTAGAQRLAQSVGVASLSPVTITATLSDGTILQTTQTPTAYDANAAVTFDLNGTGTGFVRIPDTISNNAGYTISALGDFNRDGFDDFVFTNNINNPGQNHSYVIYGRDGLLSGNISSLVTTYALPVLGSNTSEAQVVGIGDFDGDGVRDYMVSQYMSGSVGGGLVSIVNGLNPGNTTEQVMAVDFGVGMQAGQSISAIGDMNNDGYADVIIGAPGEDDAILWRGFDVTWGASAPTPVTIDRDDGSAFGSAVEGIGDFNGDGYNDFMVGGHAYDSNMGIANLYRGNQSGFSTLMSSITGSTGEQLGQDIIGLGDINGDGYSDVLIGGENTARIYFGNPTGLSTYVDLSQLGNIPGYTISGGSALGDFNGDGYDDFAISLTDGTNTHLFTVLGHGTITSSIINLTYLKTEGNALEFKFAYGDDIEISSIGDINGDGYDDFAIGGGIDINGGADGNGGLIAVYGRSTGSSATNHVGTTGTDVFSDGGGTGHNFRGGAGWDVFEISNTNFLGIDGGSSEIATYDTIRAMSDLDFSGVNYEKISGIERIEYGNASGQTLTLTMENIFNLLKTSDVGKLVIDTGSSTGNILNFTGTGLTESGASNGFIVDALNSHGNGAAVNGTANVSGNSYSQFNIGGYTLLIDTDLTVNIS